MRDFHPKKQIADFLPIQPMDYKEEMTLFGYRIKQRLTCCKCPILKDLFDMSKSILYQESRRQAHVLDQGKDFS